MAFLSEAETWAAEREAKRTQATLRSYDTRSPSERTKDAVMAALKLALAAVVVGLLLWRPM